MLKILITESFNTGIRVNDKTPSIVNNIGSALVNKKELMISSKEIDAVKNSDI